MLLRLLSSVALAALAAAGDVARPNLVFVYGDDHAQSAVGAYGSTLVETPNIDRIAAAGMRFTQSFVANSLCGPARATILTGLHSHANGQTTNVPSLRDDVPLLPELLRDAGYRTAIVGKWHLPGVPRGFDHWAVARGGYYNPELAGPDGVVAHEGYTTDVITDEALRFLASAARGEQPFFLWICHAASHRTWMPGPGYLERFTDVTFPEPATLFDDHRGRSPGAAAARMRIAEDLFPAYDLKLPVTGDAILDGAAERLLGGLTPGQRAAWDAAYAAENAAFLADPPTGDALVRWKYQRFVRDYARCVAALDDAVGRVLDAIDEAGIADRTVVVYSSDQGFFLGEHGWYDKRWMYEPSMRTPLVVRGPGIAAGATCDALVQNIDLAPTFLALAGAPVPAEMQGASLTAWLAGTPPDEWRDALYYHYQEREQDRTEHGVAPHYGLRTDRWKLIHVYEHDVFELYDLQSDPEEMHDLSRDPSHAVLLSKLKGRLAAQRTRFGDRTGKDL